MPGHKLRKPRFPRPLQAEEAEILPGHYKLRKLRFARPLFARPLQAEEAEICQAATS